VLLRFKVPQNIDMQDRIIGPLTMVQFIYAVIGGGVCYSIYSAVPAPFSYIIILPIALFVICLDFVKINERPFLNFFLAAIQYASAPKQRVWHQGSGSDLRVEIYHAKVEEAQTFTSKNISRSQITAIANKVDTGEKLIRN